MATVLQNLFPEEAQFLASAFPALSKINGTNFPVSYLAFDASAEEAAFYKLQANQFANSPVLRIYWAADTATSGDVIWGCQIAAITPDADTQDVTTDGLATAQTVTDTHLGTTARRIHVASITITNLDSLANGDIVFLRLYRDADAAGDTMTGDALFLGARIEYSDV
jgi:hypothetical protein